MNKRDLVGIAIGLLLAACLWYLLSLLFGLFLIVLATLPWHGWFGFGLFGLTTVKCLGESEVPTRRRCRLPVSARPKLRVIGGCRETAEERWGRAA
jgi:hypothetical protein